MMGRWVIAVQDEGAHAGRGGGYICIWVGADIEMEGQKDI
jgi:hypothetical protein